MMYKENVAIAVKVDGKVVRELKPGRVDVPFKSEYSVYFKNLSDRTAVVKVEIDGTDVLKGKRLIVKANQSVDLERYVDDTYYKGNKFKFIEMTDNIANNRGVKTEDGIIRVEWQFEQKYIEPVITTTVWNQPNYYGGNWNTSIDVNSITLNDRINSRTLYSKNLNVSSSGAACYSANSIQAKGQTFSGSLSNIKVGTTVNCCASAGRDSCGPMFMGETSTTGGIAGFTTKGSESNQKFTQGCVGSLELEKHSACIYMTGTTAPIITTSTKLKCEVCGQSNGLVAYCSSCGTFIGRK